jgi:site-specific DNA-methyltransferase (adenine-specific)
MADEYANRILHGEAATELASLSDESVHFVVTSPPYFDLKDYESAEQLGYGDTLSEYLANLQAMA